MRQFSMGLCLCLALTTLSQAGVYNTEIKNSPKTPTGPFVTKNGIELIPHADFKTLLNERRTLLIKPKKSNPFGGNPFGKKEPPKAKMPDGKSQSRRAPLEKRVQELRRKIASGASTIQDKINLSAYLIGLGEYREAAEVLEPETRGVHGRNFMVLANLAMAYFGEGELGRAAAYQGIAVRNWPKEWPGMTKAELDWYETVEKIQARLIRLRQGQAKDSEPSVGEVFDVSFAGKDGQYAVGKLPDGEKELPPNARAIVQQLALWIPQDNRLYWLYGEVLNAENQPALAFDVLSDCAWSRGMNAKSLMEHRNILQSAAAQQRQDPNQDTPGLSVSSNRLIIVMGIGGVLIGLLAFMQIREIIRRRQASHS